MKARLTMLVIGALAGSIFSTAVAFAWTGPTGTAPASNVSAPINVGSTDQVKNANLGVNGLAVFGNTLLQASSYLNWGTTAGTSGYGIRDNGGTLEFKNSGGSWASLQSTIYNLGGGGSWTTSGSNIYYNTGNVGVGTTNPGYKLDVQGAIAAGNSDIYFTNTTHNHTGIGNTAGYAAIENASNYNTLMILGRSGGIGGGRSVSIWDQLDVNGVLNVSKFNSGPGRVAGFFGNTTSGGNPGDAEIEVGNSLNSNDATAIGFNTGGRYGYFAVFGASVANRIAFDISGNLGIGILNPSTKLDVSGSTSWSPVVIRNNVNAGGGADCSGGGCRMIEMFGNGSWMGEIYVQNGAAYYGNGSDYRLKDHITPVDVTGALERVMQLKVDSFNYKSSPNMTFEGFLAHEAQAIVPYAVSGTKDQVDAHGAPIYQTIDYSKLTPILTAAVQGLYMKVQALADTVAGFAQSFTSRKVTTQELCVEKSDGTPVCVTGDQLAALLAK